MNNQRIDPRTIVVTVITFIFVAAGGNYAQSRPWMNKNLSPQQRAVLLVKHMTLDEKILEIHMMDTPAHPREVSAVERLGIPAFKITNGPAGAGPGDKKPTQPATALPSALALAASWDTALADTFGTVAGKEVKNRGEDLIEGPGVNITRVPRNGRNFEYFGEDPYLSGRMAVAEIRAIQRQGVIAEVKHYAANNQETDRKTINEVIDERTLREIYLPAFESAVKEGHVGAVMTAYPSINGEFGCENTHLIKDILRGEWGFNGFVQSDYTATKSAVRSSRAGLDLSMKYDHYGAEMKNAVLEGKVPESAVDSMLVRRFTEMFSYGMFDKIRSPEPIPVKKDGAVSRSIAEQCAVLLKNNGDLLPIHRDEIHSIAVIGPYAGKALTGGGGSSEVNPFYTVSPVDGIISHAGKNISVIYNNGSNERTAVYLAEKVDVVLVMVGNKDREGKDRPDISLPGNQDSLISAVAAANPHTVVILKTGGAVLMPWLDKVPAVLEVWYPGEEDGNVAADLIFGNVNPSGKLPLTFPKTESQEPVNNPAQYPGINGTATYSEKLLVGYRWYDERNVEPLFPFGYGLSYSTFAFSNLTVSPLSSDGKEDVSVNIINSGKLPGADVVQLYVAFPAAAGEPPKQLKAFAKVNLKPGETKRVNLKLDKRAFSIWDTSAGRWTVVKGKFGIFVGDSSRRLPLKGSIKIDSPEK